MTDQEENEAQEEDRAQEEDEAQAPRIRPKVADDVPEVADEPTTDEPTADEPTTDRRVDWARVVAYGILPGLALILALAAGGLKYVDNSVRDADLASAQALQVAKDSTVAILSYKPETVEQQLTDARNLLTGEFRNSYTDLTTKVVIPGATQQRISAAARVPAAASVSADPGHAVVLLFVNQTVTIGGGVPSDTASSVRVTLERVGGKWLISNFDPV